MSNSVIRQFKNCGIINVCFHNLIVYDSHLCIKINIQIKSTKLPYIFLLSVKTHKATKSFSFWVNWHGRLTKTANLCKLECTDLQFLWLFWSRWFSRSFARNEKFISTTGNRFLMRVYGGGKRLSVAGKGFELRFYNFQSDILYI